jgi:hypothetical protein
MFSCLCVCVSMCLCVCISLLALNCTTLQLRTLVEEGLQQFPKALLPADMSDINAGILAALSVVLVIEKLPVIDMECPTGPDDEPVVCLLLLTLANVAFVYFDFHHRAVTESPGRSGTCRIHSLSAPHQIWSPLMGVHRYLPAAILYTSVHRLSAADIGAVLGDRIVGAQWPRGAGTGRFRVAR